MKNSKRYDFIILGGGLGGLVSAALLSKNGHSVLVLEKNQQMGGSLQIFSRDKRIFDTGVHYIGGLKKGQNLHSLFDYLGIMENLNLEQMDSKYDLIHFNNETQYYAHSQGHEEFVNNLSKDFPDERENLQNYINTVKEVCDSFPFYRLKYFETDYFNNLSATKNAYDTISSFTKNEKLRNILAGSGLLYGGVRDKTPFYVHALVVNSFIESAHRCIKGGSQIAIQLAKKIRENGGELVKKCTIVSAEYEGKNIRCVVDENGNKYFAENFISNIYPKQSLNIFGEDHFRKAYVNRIKNLENTVSSYSVHLALKPNTIKYKNHNIYHFNSDSVWDHEKYNGQDWPVSYLVSMSPSKENQKWADSISILLYMRYEEVEPWANTFNTIDNKSNRDEAYQNFKKNKEKAVIEDLKKLFPDIEEAIYSVYSSSPLTFRDYIGTEDGNLYGVLKDSNNPLKTMISHKTKVPNLYFTGQNLNLHGVLGVTISAFLTCLNFLDQESVMNEINEK